MNDLGIYNKLSEILANVIHVRGMALSLTQTTERWRDFKGAALDSLFRHYSLFTCFSVE